MVTETARQKEQRLREYLKSLGSVAVAFSGGVDSTFLIKVAHDVLGDRAIAVTAQSESFAAQELSDAKAFCEKEGIRHFIVKSSELDIPGFAENPPDRCYLCKKRIFGTIFDTARSQGIEYVAEGSNQSDQGDYRPGMQAIRELGVKSPLLEAGLEKSEIRVLSKDLGLPTWDKPSAACLASRFVYGEQITREKLRMVEQAEARLTELGFRQKRVRMHGKDLARIEVEPDALGRLLNVREEVTEAFREIGFTYVTMDLQGYRVGSMNEALDLEQKEK